MRYEDARRRGHHQGWHRTPEEGPSGADVAGEGPVRWRGGPPPPGGPGPFGFRGRRMGGWRGGPGWPPHPGFTFADPRRHRGPRAKRGDVRAAALTLLAEESRNGYQIIQEIESRSGGVWRPSPGSVYPALQQLEDEGLVRTTEAEGGRKAFELTDEGRAFVAAHADELAAPWDAVAGMVPDDMIDMRQLFGQVAMAAEQVFSVGTEAQIQSARQVLILARKNLYGILASDDDQASGQPAADKTAQRTAGKYSPGDDSPGEE
ncbi:MAG TPA: PadR family transcriptional regulator [Streptosporangiaceae bacterium]|nr:PadR family transcriptional regulator [Streptosporangiaceae bacterium]